MSSDTMIEPAATTLPSQAAPLRDEASRRMGRRTLLSRWWAPALAATGAAVATSSLAACDVASGPVGRSTHVLRRLTNAATPDALTRFEAMGETAWLSEQLVPGGLNTADIDAKLDALPALSMTAAQLDVAYPGRAFVEARMQLQVAWIIRAVHSPAQLFERLVDFFSDHFNVAMENRNLSLLKLVDDRDVIRAHATGRFADLLVASAKSPAMLLYLDNGESFADNINENYARELLELHTVGVDGGYTEADVVATARLLTGWTIDPATYTFQFRANRHDPGPVTIMGWQRPSGTDYQSHGEQFLTWLARREATGRFVCTKLARRFVADDPPSAIVDAMVAAWGSSDTAIGPVIEAMVAHNDFQSAVGNKLRRPLDYLAFGLRATAAEVQPTTDRSSLLALGHVLAGLGQVPFMWSAPNGYPDVEGAWLNGGALLGRWNMMGDVLSGASPIFAVNLGELGGGLEGRTEAEVFDALARSVLGEPVTSGGRSVLRDATGWAEDQVPSAASFAAGIPQAVLALLTSADAQYR